MSNTATLLGNLLNCKAEYNYAVYEQTKWSGLYESNASKLAAQQSAEEKWQTAYDSAYDCGYGYSSSESDLKAGGVTISYDNCTREAKFSAYASAKVSSYNADALEEYSDLDVQYDLMTTTYDAMVESLAAMIESYEESVSTSAQDTGLLDS